MNTWSAMDGIWLVAVLVLAVSALSARRLSLGFVARSLLIWAAIILAVVVAVAHRHDLKAAFARVSETLGLDEQQVQGETVRIKMGPDGHFWAQVTINDTPVRLLIDSGATVTALSKRTAKAAGVKVSGELPAIIETANGSIAAQRGTIETLAIGPLKTTDLGVVVSENFGDMDVLGMNFLSRLHSWRVENGVLVLEPKAGAVVTE
ncbi:TIGR02281 family clan AA aspartic protease [Sphingomonas sp. CJ20]